VCRPESLVTILASEKQATQGRSLSAYPEDTAKGEDAAWRSFAAARAHETFGTVH